MTPELIRAWCEDWGKRGRAAWPALRSRRREQMEQDIEARVRALNAVADRLYDRWIEGLKALAYATLRPVSVPEIAELQRDLLRPMPCTS